MSSRNKTLWYKDAIIYELHVKAFHDSNRDGMGDFRGLVEKLDYLEDLGITALWLLPFYPSPLRDDGYDIADYRGIHPHYGTLRDFKLFIREAHRRGIRVITELVVNHTSDQHAWFQSARRAKPGSARRNLYVWSHTDTKYPETRIIFTDTETSNWAWDPLAGAYYWHRFFSHQPDLNLNNPRVVQEVIKVLNFWFRMGVDGLRLDAVPYLCVREGTNNENLEETHQVIKQFRKYTDDHFDDRMLLAEANQWPEDVVEYFGDNDECHMAFHFPLMPRMFMALRQEDRTPIIEILNRTPAVPEACQWGLFLRNHDELTLEMVTDEERDYMYREYAADSLMRVNVGIRRRLAPLVNNSLRRRELLHSLLFSLPGTPIIYYGDEIGMGDNVHLGDRNGVRTPMQWTADRNAGFSRADPAELYLPVIMDPVYGYQGVNVEAQQRNPSSFYHFIRRMIALRKQYKAFGRGTIQFLQPENRKVLAYLRRYREEVILVTANLSRFVQPAELDLSEFNGWNPVEMLGRVEFPRIGELPYFITLGPHAFYWFRLEPEAEAIVVGIPARREHGSIPTLVLEGDPVTIMEPEQQFRLETSVLKGYLPKQRYFQGKARELVSCRIADSTKVGHNFFMTLVRVHYADGGQQLYSIPLKIASGHEATRIMESVPESVLALIKTARGNGVVFDALTEKTACQDILMAIRDSRYYPTAAGGRVGARSTALFTEETKTELNYSNLRRLSTEQSNTSVVLNESFILKVYRQVEEGLNPDLEVALFLTERTAFENLPQVAGTVIYRHPDGTESTLAMLQQFVANDGDGWSYVQQGLADYFTAVSQLSTGTEPPSPARRRLREGALAVAPKLARDLFAGMLESVHTLGQRTAEFHLAMASDRRSRAFRPEPLNGETLESLADTFSTKARRSLERLNEQLPNLAPPVREQAHRVLGASTTLLTCFEALAELETTATRIRCHGDYHLGQVLKTGDDFILIDFEGEPLLSLQQRRLKQSPLKDVAGMLRSFSYAVYSALDGFVRERNEDFQRLQPWGRFWEERVSAAFLGSYLERVEGACFIPKETRDLEVLLEAFLFDKAFYELDYELNNRPDWIWVPLQGILALLEDEKGGKHGHD